MTTIDEIVQAFRDGRISLEPWQRSILDAELDAAERRRSDAADALELATTRHRPQPAHELAPLTEQRPRSAYDNYAMFARSLGTERAADQLAEFEIAVDAFRAELALARRDRPARSSMAEPELDVAFLRRSLRWAIRDQRRIAAAEAKTLGDRSSAGRMREAARSILYSANRTANALEAALRAADAIADRPASIDAAHIERQRTFSLETFGPGERGAAVVAHIRKELDEILDDPTDLVEWADVIILAIDGAWRAGHEPQAIVDAIVGKQARNEARTWPDWRSVPEGQPIEHVTEGQTNPTTESEAP